MTSAPSLRAQSSLSSARSTAITRAPIAAASCTTFRPTPPQPNTSTQSPGTTRPRRTTAWNGVVMASAMIEPSSSGISGGRR